MYLPTNGFALFLYVMLNVKTFQNRLFVGDSSFLHTLFYEECLADCQVKGGNT
jgi:hypothetical protein